MESTSQHYQLKKTEIVLRINTPQFPIIQLVIGQSQIVLLFENYLQLWDMDTNTLISKQRSTQSLKSSLHWVKMTQTSFIFITPVQSQKNNKLLIWDLKTATEEVVSEKLKSYFDRLRFICYFSQSGIISASSGFYQKKTLQTWIPVKEKQYLQIHDKNFDFYSGFYKYNDRETLAAINTKSTNLTFQLLNCKGNTTRSYNLNPLYKSRGKIEDIRQFSESDAIITISKNENSSQVIVFSLLSNEVVKKTQVPFQCSRIVNLGWFWVATSCLDFFQNPEHDPTRQEFKMLRLFANDKENFVMIQKPAETFCFHVHPLFFDFDSIENREKGIFKMVRVDLFAGKRNYYIHLLEESGLTVTFGSEVVKWTLYNFDENQL